MQSACRRLAASESFSGKSLSISKLLAQRAPARVSRRSNVKIIRAAQAGLGDGVVPPRKNNNYPARLLSGLKSLAPPAVVDVASKVVKSYNSALAKHPVATKAVTSLIGFAIGDRIAQSIGGGAPFDVYRCLRLSLYGLLIDGPIGHYFYAFLDQNVKPEDPKGAQAVITKTAIDQLLWAPAMTVVFLAFLTTLEGRPEAIVNVVQSKLLTIYLANLTIWPVWHVINFRYVAPEQRILFNNVVAIAWTTYLSWFSSGACHSGTPRDALMAGVPCAAQAAVAMLQSHHMADVIRQTSAVELLLGGWGTDSLPAAAGPELLMNHVAMKAEIAQMCSVPPLP